MGEALGSMSFGEGVRYYRVQNSFILHFHILYYEKFFITNYQLIYVLLRCI